MFVEPQPFAGRHTSQVDADAAIRLTDTDAVLARYSAVQKGYIHDPFIKPLLPRGAQFQPARPPLINVGTYVRSEGIDSLVNQWLALSRQEGKNCQIVSLGAGSDSRFWRIATGPTKDVLSAYIEVDFPEITTKKAMAISKSRDLKTILGDPSSVRIVGGGTAVHSPVYRLIPADLRSPPQVALSHALVDSSEGPLLSPSLPTLIVFECVLAYMSPAASNAVIQWFADYLSATTEGAMLGGIVYEMFGLNDSFGKVMLNNLKARNVELPGVEPYPTFASLPNRFLQLGFNSSQALTLRDIRRSCVGASELERLSQLEMLDELEELELVLQHYAITWGLKTFPNGEGLRANWAQWGLKPKA